LPKIQNSINTYYPGTKLAVTEFSYGAPEHFSGGIATADVLGIFGKYGLYMSNYWGSDYNYVSAAYKIYRNYDGNKSTFGNIRVKAVMSDKQNSSIYAAVSGHNDAKLHLIVINKSFDYSINAAFNISSPIPYVSAEVWAFDSISPNISEISPVEQITNNSFSYTISPLTVCHIVLKAQCPAGDITGDCTVDYRDLLVLSQQWLQPDGIADIDGLNGVNMFDFALLAENWLQ
jgi:hypothetical protein